MKAILPALLLSALIAVPVFSQESSDTKLIADHFTARIPDGESFAGKAEAFFKSLDLSDAQLEKLANLKDTYMTSTAAKKAELKSLRRQICNLLLSPTIDKQQLSALEDKANSLRADLANQRLFYAEDKSEVLTAEQRKTIHRKMLEMSVMPHPRFGRQHMHG